MRKPGEGVHRKKEKETEGREVKVLKKILEQNTGGYKGVDKWGGARWTKFSKESQGGIVQGG